MNPEEKKLLMQRIETLEFQLGQLLRPGVVRFETPIVGGTSGLKIGLSTTDKMGFYGYTPIAQYSTTGDTGHMTTNGGAAVTEANGFKGASALGNAYTIGDIVTMLKTRGDLAP